MHAVTEDGASQATLSPAQLRMWAGQAMHRGSALYNMALGWRIEGDLCAQTFARAFSELVAEADALRVVVVEAGDVPSQRVLPEIDPAFEIVDLRAEPAPEASARAMIQERARRNFDLTQRSFDSALFRTGNSDWIWYFNQHHIFTDATSFAVLFHRMSELYAEAEHTGPKGAPLARFIDYLAAPVPERQRQAARDHFDGRRAVPPRLYGKRRFQPDTRSERIEVSLSAHETRVFSERARQKEWAALTPQMAGYQMVATVLLAFLWRVSGQSDVAVGAPVHNRGTPEARRTAGLLIDVLPMGVEIEPGETFATLYGKVCAETARFLRHAVSGLDAGSLQNQFGTVLNFITARFGSFAGRPCRSEWFHSGQADPNHHLRLQVQDFDGEGLRFYLDVNRAALPDPSAVADHFAGLLRGFLADPQQSIDAVPLMSATEESQISEACTGARVDRPFVSVMQMIAEAAAKNPDAVAIDAGQRTLSYAQLGARVDALAGALQARGITPGARVALEIPRSTAAVVAILAVLRCGAAFVQIDPSLPEQRRQFLYLDAGCAARIAFEPGTETVVVDPDGLCDGQPVTPLSNGPDDLAYVLYTSGSTGLPKGVAIPHRGLSHYIDWARNTYCGQKRLRFALFTPLGFDLTVTSIFVPLATGGSIRVYPESGGGLDLAVLDVVAEDVVDVVKLTPSHLRLIVGHDLSRSAISQLIVGGEDLTCALAQEVHAVFGGRCAIHNEYGPTEATVGCIVYRFDPHRDRLGSVPIGQPIENMKARILNAAGTLQPTGVPGELYLSGAGLALGYFGKPGLTRRAFVEIDGETCYCTGDLARIREDGLIEYLGRMDHQVKVNGVRVEIGEIEAALAAIPGVQAAAVTLRSPAAKPAALTHCRECGLGSDYPDASFDDTGLCSICAEFARYKDNASRYFRDLDALRQVLSARLPCGAEYDAVVLLSGGKDSTYMLGRLVGIGLKCLAFTLDNGFISEQAKANIDRVVAALGVTHIYGAPPGMNEIFADSLKRFSNVCNGCFKAIYTMGMQIAFERDIPFLITGLSRGQFFETRLTPELFADGAPAAAEIDAMVLQARKTYHRTQDAVTACLDASVFNEDAIFEAVEVVDFYRYCDVGLDEIYRWLDERLPWVRPSDTGRSTNCRINDVGIHVHKLERGFHNYALPYSWDVRMGHKNREAALAELDDDIELASVERMLDQIGYRPAIPEAPQAALVAHLVGAVDETALRAGLTEKLPAYMVPSQFAFMEALPLSKNGKVDRDALPDPQAQPKSDGRRFEAPANPSEVEMARIWQQVLAIGVVGRRDNFFDLGGDSIAAIRINSRARKAGFELQPGDIFEAQTVADLVRAAQGRMARAEQDVRPGPLPLMAAQAWLLEGFDKMPPVEAQILRVRLPQPVSADALSAAWARLAAHHDGLRSAFRFETGEWRAQILAQAPPPIIATQARIADLAAQLDPESASHVAVLLEDRTATFILHHLVIDAASWPVLLGDLARALDMRGFARKTASVREWASKTGQQPPLRSVTPLAALGAISGSSAAQSRHASCTIPKSEVDALRRRSKSLEKPLLKALGIALGRETCVAVERSGRIDPEGLDDASRTVGWFTQFERLIVSPDSEPRLAPEGATPAAPVLFNLLDGNEMGATEIVPLAPLTLWRAPNAPLRHALTINATLGPEGLEMDWQYPGDPHALAGVTEAFRATVRKMTAETPEAPAQPAGRFERATGQANMDKLAALLGKGNS